MASTTAGDNTSRRRSGRVSRRPDLFLEELHEGNTHSNGSAKRKRIAGDFAGGKDHPSDEDETVLPSFDSESGGELDEEELKAQQRVARKQKSRNRPAPKKPRTSDGVDGTPLAIRSANRQFKPAFKSPKVSDTGSRPGPDHQDGLYIEVFRKDRLGEDVAAQWLRAYNHNNVLAMAELVNLVLECTGCDSKVDEHDIEDVDNVPSKLGDIQDELQQSKVTEYPLISKLKQYVAFKPALADFFSALVKMMHTSSILYEDTALYDNVQAWVDTMSSAGIRPFRHTATFISLAMSVAFCEVAKELLSSISTTRVQIESEKRKKSVNKGRIGGLEEKVKLEQTKLESINTILKDEFDVVFVHRYRDVDSKVRLECVSALGTWILTYREMFLEGQYLRYFGWLLSDSVWQTRSEVLKQLKSLFKNSRNIPALRAFTERFRPRIVEMAARDAEAGVRADAVELLDWLRDSELLEPNDIDEVGKLIFDSEPRVRRAVAKFFVSTIDELYRAITEDFDAESFEEALPKRKSGDNFLNPTQSWIRYKCLAQTLATYNECEGDEDGQHQQRQDVLNVTELDSRYMLAAQSIFPLMKDLHEWETLAGYLLYDHSKITTQTDDSDVSAAAQAAYKINDGEDIVLLEVLDYAVKLSLRQVEDSQTEKKGRKTQANRDDAQEKQASIAYNLTLVIPQLLNKFGSTPQAAAAILRLEHLLNLEAVTETQQSEVTISGLLDDVNKQFSTHSDPRVLAEASVALLKSKQNNLSKEIAESKIQEMWEDALRTLRTLLRNHSVDTRGTLSIKTLTEVCNTAARLVNLASVSEPVTALESKFSNTITPKKGKVQNVNLTPLAFLFELAKRGKADEESTTQFAALEDDLCISVTRLVGFYFCWKFSGIRESLRSHQTRHLTSDYCVSLNQRKDAFIQILEVIINSRHPIDPVRLAAITVVLDIYALFSTLRHVRVTNSERQLPEEMASRLKSLNIPVPVPIQRNIMTTHEKLQKTFAKQTHRRLDLNTDTEPGDGDKPIDSDDEDDEDDEVGDQVSTREPGKGAKVQSALVAEQRLCEISSKIVLAVLGCVMNGDTKQKLLANRTRLGPNYKDVCAYLATEAVKQGWSKTSARKEFMGTTNALTTSAVMVLTDDDIEEEHPHDQDYDNQDGDADEDQTKDFAGKVVDNIEAGTHNRNGTG